MKFSWSHKLFFKINQQIGKREWLDRLMLISAHWVIYFLAFVVLSWGSLVLSETSPELFITFIKLILTALIFAIATNWLLSLVWVHRRPMIEFPEIKFLFEPYKTWKSFPSDHTTIAFILVFIPFLLGISWWFFTVLIILALLVGLARIYCGVHYPRDIMGGIIMALFYAWAASWLLNNATQPLYILIKNIFI